jgi:hypothetical protein
MNRVLWCGPWRPFVLLAATTMSFGSVRASAQQAPVPQSAARPPLPNRANEVMPSWLRVRGELRERVEGISGSGFVDGRDDAYWLTRFRFNATITPSRQLAFQVQAQDARVADKEFGATGAPFRSSFDLRMAFADIGAPTSGIAARVGRQELAYGDQRLVGHVSWLNAARTFDAAKVTLRSKPIQVDLFAASVVRILPGEFDTSGNGNLFAGAYATTTALVPKSSVEPYVFWRGDRNISNESGRNATLRAATIGVRWVGQLPARLDYNSEMAVQTGSLGSDSVGTWAGHWQLRQSYGGPHAVRIAAELNVASGDADPADGKRGTFDQLYPTPHDKYGLADQVGWRNIRHVRTGLEFTPGKKWQLGANYHSWWLMDGRDALYSAGGVAVARVAAGAASRFVGQEIDMQVARPLTPQLSLAAGIAHIFPGRFLEQATPGASYTAPFVMATYVFLADK